MKKKKNEITIRSSAAEYLTYVASIGDQQDSIEMRYEDENIWLTQKMMATLYDVETNTINYHIKKVFNDSELQEDSVIRKFRITAADGKSYNTNHYSLEMIIAVGFKVNSERAVQFRKWVNQIAKDYTIKGWVMDDERLKRGTYLTEKYFDEQLERIREIRASERKFYQKITDIYATAIDYDKNSATTKRFYATVQNKMHFAIHGHTAAELIVERADHTKDHMGLKKLDTMSREELTKIIVDFYKTNKSIEEGLSLMLLGEEYGSALLEKYKKQLYKIFNPKNIVRTGFSLEKAQMVLSDFADVCMGDNGRWYGDLALYFAECATDFTMSYGDIDEDFYDALGDAYHDAVVIASGEEQLYKLWKERLEYILYEFSGFGWGMEDFIAGEYYSLPWIEED